MAKTGPNIVASRRTMMLTALSAALAGRAAAAAPGAAPPVLRIGNVEEPDTLDPQLANSLASWRIGQDLFTGLLTLDAGGRPVAGAAQSAEVLDGGRRYRFTLRPHQWSDGKPVTAADFVFAMRRAVDPHTASQASYLFYVVENGRAISSAAKPPAALGVRAPEPMVLEIELARPAPYFPYLLTQPVAAPLRADVLARHGRDWSKPGNAVSNGPYRLAEWRPNDYVRVTRNPYFFGRAQIRLDEVFYYPIADANAALKQFRTGGLDLCLDWPPEQLQLLKTQYAAQTHMAPVLAPVWIACNLEKGALRDPRVRRALALAIDREVIVSRILRVGESAAYRLAPPQTPGLAPGPVAADFARSPMAARRAEAIRLLAAAGYSAAAPLNLKYNGISNSEGRRVGAALQAMWHGVGVTAELVFQDAGSHYTAMQTGDYELGYVRWLADVPDPSSFLGAIDPDGANYLHTGYASNDYRTLLRAAAADWNPLSRAQRLAQAEQVALADLPVLPVYFDTVRELVAANVQGYRQNFYGVHPARWLSLAAR